MDHMFRKGSVSLERLNVKLELDLTDGVAKVKQR